MTASNLAYFAQFLWPYSQRHTMFKLHGGRLIMLVLRPLYVTTLCVVLLLKLLREQGIAPTLILVRVGLGTGTYEETVKTLEFAKTRQSDP